MGVAGPYADRRAARTSALCAAALLCACGARSDLGLGAAPATTSSGGSAGTPAIEDAGADHPDAASSCSLDDLSTWRTERYRDHGDYERPVAALDGVPWIALKLKGGNVVLEKLGVDAAQGIVVEDSIEIPDSPVYPAGFDLDARRFVLLTTTGQNWNGDAELWRIDRANGGILRIPVGTAADPAYVIYSALGLAGDDVVLAYASGKTQGTVELRDDALDVIQSMPVDSSTFEGVRSGDAVDVYLGKTGRVHAEGGTLTQSPVDPDWPVVGGLDGLLVETGVKIRLTDGTHNWDADWPHTQISPPAVVRTGGSRVAFSLETELTGVVGYLAGGKLNWLQIESGPDAPGTGLALLPVVAQNRLGLFYLGLEIPSPEQPLRYYGLVCP